MTRRNSLRRRQTKESPLYFTSQIKQINFNFFLSSLLFFFLIIFFSLFLKNKIEQKSMELHWVGCCRSDHHFYTEIDCLFSVHFLCCWLLQEKKNSWSGMNEKTSTKKKASSLYICKTAKQHNFNAWPWKEFSFLSAFTIFCKRLFFLNFLSTKNSQNFPTTNFPLKSH